MDDAECVRFLQWALPRLRLRWPGFRKVRRQVCRRVQRRLADLGLPDLAAYRSYLEANPQEWQALDALTHITISRFYRDRGAFALLQREVAPALARLALERGAAALEAWSAGCASGEEPYTLAIMWKLAAAPEFPGLGLRVLATDLDDAMLRRAREGCYTAGSFRDLPAAWRAAAFVERDGLHCLRPEFREAVAVARHDIRAGAPDGPFDLVLCRNLAFTYFAEDLQHEVCARLAACLRPGGALALGAHESLPEGAAGFVPWPRAPGVYRRPD